MSNSFPLTNRDPLRSPNERDLLNTSRESGVTGHNGFPHTPLGSRPGSPLPAPSFVSQNTDRGSSYSVYHGGDSSVNLLQYPRPTFHHQNSSVSSFASAYDGDTMCQTPVGEKGYLEEGDISKSRHSTFHSTQSINSFEKQFDPSSYQLQQLHKHDDEIFLPPWKRFLYRLSPLFTLLATVAYFGYYGYRIYCTVLTQRAYGKIYIMAWLFIAAEGAVACMSIFREPCTMANILRSCNFASNVSNAFHPWTFATKASYYR